MVSENELLGQIAIEEEVLRDRLDKAAFKLRNAKTVTDEQVSKLSITGSDYTLVSLRVDDIRKAILDAGTAAREVYQRLSAHPARALKSTASSRTKTDDVREKIVLPLGEIVDPNFGNFTTTEAALEKLYAALDDDITLKKGEENRGPARGQRPSGRPTTGPPASNGSTKSWWPWMKASWKASFWN